MTITINGEKTERSASVSVRELLKERCGNQFQGVAIAKNGAILRREKWDTPLTDGDEIEIIVASQGG